MDNTTLIIIVLVLLAAAGFYGRGRWCWRTLSEPGSPCCCMVLIAA